ISPRSPNWKAACGIYTDTQYAIPLVTMSDSDDDESVAIPVGDHPPSTEADVGKQLNMPLV
ncbi:hypothetical protein G9A89_021704, partial [Geosiphon pyriformis]